MGLSLSTELLDRIHHHATRLGIETDELINRALTDFLRDEDRTEQLLESFGQPLAPED